MPFRLYALLHDRCAATVKTPSRRTCAAGSSRFRADHAAALRARPPPGPLPGSPGVAWGFCLAICLVTVALFSSFLRISYHLNPFYWLGYSAYAYTFFPFAGLRTPLNRGAVAAAEEYARELAKDLDDMANIYEYEKLHEERERARRAAAR